MISLPLEWSSRPFRKIGDGQVRKLNVNDFYLLGKSCNSMTALLEKMESSAPFSQFMLKLYYLRSQFRDLLEEPCSLVSSTARAARAVVDEIDSLIPADVDELFKIDGREIVPRWKFNGVKSKLSNFETVLTNDMPEMSTYAVSQIGIMRTDDLIDRAYYQIAEPLRPLLLAKAKTDIIEAGKCLAFRLSTASAFHACRAIEAGMDQYYEALCGHPYKVSDSGGNNNWGAKTEALIKSNADEKITEFLTHIRKQYRNPVTHPEIVVDEHEAVDLFGASLSAISMMLGATRILISRNQLVLPGIPPKMIGLESKTHEEAS
jgi:hypothetical protein